VRRVPALACERFLVIGYGNTLRSDDGVGPRVAAAVGKLGLPGVDTLACPQLTPELAETVSQADAVVFVDASADLETAARLVPVSPGPTTRVLAHAADPATILALARDLYGAAPRAWLLTIPAADLRFGEELSARARVGLGQAVAKISRLRTLV
jgi:hydrogenase maturation protease